MPSARRRSKAATAACSRVVIGNPPLEWNRDYLMPIRRGPLVARGVFERRQNLGRGHSGNGSTLPRYPHTPTHPQALQKSQPSFLISAKLLQSGHFMPFIFGAAPGAGGSSTPIACTG